MSEKELAQTNEPKNDIDDAVTPDKSNEDAQAAHLQRRRVLTASLAAVPVLLTLKSRSVFAAHPDCSVVHSIELNGATSQHPGVTIDNGDIQSCQNQ